MGRSITIGEDRLQRCDDGLDTRSHDASLRGDRAEIRIAVGLCIRNRAGEFSLQHMHTGSVVAASFRSSS